MKIVEIQSTPDGEVAYILDETEGRVLKVRVEDYTFIDAEAVIPAPRRRVVRRSVVEPVEDTEVAPPAPQPPPPPRKPAPSIMPPGVASIFRPAGTPGAAVETRSV